MSVAETIFLCPDTRDLCILGVQGKLLVEGRMSIARRSAQAHCLPADPAGVPPHYKMTPPLAMHICVGTSLYKRC
jgi:hypothetical protein